jgi:hypothetical protein
MKSMYYMATAGRLQYVIAVARLRYLVTIAGLSLFEKFGKFGCTIESIVTAKIKFLAYHLQPKNKWNKWLDAEEIYIDNQAYSLLLFFGFKAMVVADDFTDHSEVVLHEIASCKVFPFIVHRTDGQFKELSLVDFMVACLAGAMDEHAQNMFLYVRCLDSFNKVLRGLRKLGHTINRKSVCEISVPDSATSYL